MASEDIKLKALVHNCFTCDNAMCSKSCSQGLDVARIIRAIKFDNIDGARALLPQDIDCEKCAEKSCICNCARGKLDESINIPKIMSNLKTFKINAVTKVDLSTDICNVKCENPFFLSSSVVGSNYEMVAKAFDMGWAGVAFKTIGMFVPKEVSPRFSQVDVEGDKVVEFKNIEQISDHNLEENVEFLRKLKKNYPDKIIMASIMGRNEGEWTK